MYAHFTNKLKVTHGHLDLQINVQLVCSTVSYNIEYSPTSQIYLDSDKFLV